MGSAESQIGYRPRSPKPCFIVKNITHLKGEPKIINIFNFPILPEKPQNGMRSGERDLLEIPGIGVSDIELSLMSGVLKHKLLAKEILIIKSNIELIQFDEDFKTFLKNSGITIGVEIPEFDGYVTATLPYIWKMSQKLIGVKNGSNRIFYTLEPFLNGITQSGDVLYIEIFHNGRRLVESVNYSIAKSTPLLDGYDMIQFFLSPDDESEIEVNYAIKSI